MTFPRDDIRVSPNSMPHFLLVRLSYADNLMIWGRKGSRGADGADLFIILH